MANERHRGDQVQGIPTDDWNSFVRASKQIAQLMRPGNSPGNSAGVPNLTIELFNKTGAPITAAFPVLKIDTPTVTLANRTNMLYEPMTYEGATPNSTTSISDVGIVQGPIASNQSGVAIISGYTPCEVNITDVLHTHALPSDGDNTKLTSGTTGARIVWRESGTGTKKAVILVGGGGGTDRLVAAGTDDTAPATLIQKLSPTDAYNSSTDRLAGFEEFDDAGVKKVRGFIDISDFITSGSEKKRLISGAVYTFVAADDFSVVIKNIQVLAGGLDPRTVPGDPDETLNVVKDVGFTILNVGDQVTCAWDASAVEWVIISTERARLIRGVVKATVYSTDTGIVLDHVVTTASGLDPRFDPTDATEEVEISNLFSRSYNAGDIIDAVWNPLNQEWEPISPERFRTIRGKCAANVPSTDLTFNVNSVAVLDSGLDPRIDPTDADETVEIQNVIDAGESHNLEEWVWADYNDKDDVWEARPKSGGGGTIVVLTLAEVFGRSGFIRGSGSVQQVDESDLTFNIGAPFDAYNLSTRSYAAGLFVLATKIGSVYFIHSFDTISLPDYIHGNNQSIGHDAGVLPKWQDDVDCNTL